MEYKNEVDYELIKLKEKVEKVRDYESSYFITNFIDLAKQYHLENYVKKWKLNLTYFNYQDERKVACIYQDRGSDISPIVYLEIQTHESLKHNEIMGAILNIGIKREMIGDIHVVQNHYYIAIINSMKSYIMDHFLYVSSYPIKLVECKEVSFHIEHEKKQIIVSSMRLDNIVSSIFHMSREDAKEAIILKNVFLNFSNNLKIDQKVKEDSYLSCRKKGKVKIHKQLGNTRKDNIILDVEFF